IPHVRHNETPQDKVGFFGFFECEYDEGAIRALFAAATEWVRARGFDTLRGPASFSVNDECGLLVDGYDTPPTLMMPHNPPWYTRGIGDGGVEKATELLGCRAGYAARD